MATAALPGRTVAVMLVRSSRVSVASAGGGIEAIEHDLSRVALRMVNSESNPQPCLDGRLYIAPLTASDGHMIGVVGVSDCSTVDEVSSLVEDIVVSLELEIWRRRSEPDRSDWALSAAIDEINRSRTLDQVASSFERYGREAVGAAFVSVVRADQVANRIVQGDESDDMSDLWDHVHEWERRPLLAAVADGEPQLLLEVPVADIGSYSAMPVSDSTGQARLGVGFGFAGADAELGVPAAIRRLAAAAGHATRRVIEHEAAEDHVGVLTKVVLPDALPRHEAIELFGEYVAPTQTQRVGGDVYDAWLRPDGTMGIFVADVAGHSLRSTQVAALLRHAAGVLTLQGEPPADILKKVNGYLQSSADSLLATCCYCVVDPVHEQVNIANAGHPQPRILREDGSVTRVGPRGERLLGHGDVSYSETECSFNRGDSLVLLTDGLIERRGIDLERGELALEDLLAGCGEVTAEGVAHRLFESLDDEREDDVVVVVARLRRVRESFERRWTADDLALAKLRRELTSWLKEFVDPAIADADSVILVATELLANARQAATGHEIVVLTCNVSDDELVLTVTNPGREFGLETTMPDVTSERNRGLPIVHALSEVSVDSAGPGLVCVTARFTA